MILELLRPHSRVLLGVLALSGLAAIGEAAGLALVSLLLNQLLGSTSGLPTSGLLEGLSARARSNPGGFFALVGVVYVARGVVTLLANYASIAVSLRIGDQWRMRLFAAMLGTPVSAERTKQGVLIQTVLDEPAIAANGLVAAGILAQAAASALTVYVTLIWLSPMVALALTAIAGIALAILTLLFRRARKISDQRSQIYRDGYGYITEMLSSLRQIKLFGLEEGVVRRAEGLVRRMRMVNRTGVTLGSSPRVLIEIVFVTAFAVILGVLAPRIGQVTLVSAAGLAVVAAMRLLPSFSMAAGTWVQVQRAIPAIRRIGSELQRLESSATERPDLAEAPTLSSNVEVRALQFAYPQRSWALRGIDLKIDAGSFVALVGPSGSGKSTLLDLICGLHDPADGGIIVDGVDLQNVSKASWRKQLGVVPQDGFLLSGTIGRTSASCAPTAPKTSCARRPPWSGPTASWRSCQPATTRSSASAG